VGRGHTEQRLIVAGRCTHPSSLLPPLDIRIPVPPGKLQARKTPLERLFLRFRRWLGVVDVFADRRCEEIVALTNVGSPEGIGVC
jgi:hypothetical protein